MREVNDAIEWLIGTFVIAVFLIGCGVIGMFPGAAMYENNVMIVGALIGGAFGICLAIGVILIIHRLRRGE